MRRACTVLSLFAFLAAPCIEAKEEKKRTNKAKQELKSKDDDVAGWARRTEGHRPHDMNGDGKITRNEWPGNDESFHRLDRDRDGVISQYDRSLRPNTSNV